MTVELQRSQNYVEFVNPATNESHLKIGDQGVLTLGSGLLLNRSGILLDFAGVTATPDTNRTYCSFGYGTRVTEKDITMAASTGQNLDPIQFNLNIIGSNPSASSQVNIIYQLITHDTTDMTNMRLKGGDWSIAIGKNIKDAYVFQGEIDFSGTVTVGGEAAILGLTMNAGSGTVSGNLWGVIIVTTGASLPAGSSAALFLSHRGGTLGHSIYIEANSSQTITDAIYLNAAGTITNVINIVGVANTVLFLKANAEAGCIENFSSAGSGIASIKCEIGGVSGWLHVYDSA